MIAAIFTILYKGISFINIVTIIIQYFGKNLPR